MSWKKVKLGNICTRVITGKTPPTSVAEYFGGPIKWITPSDFDKKEISSSNRTITQKAIDENKAPLFSPNSILINCIGNIGKVGILRTKDSSNQQITAIGLVKDIYADFFYYQLLLKKDQLINLGNKSVVPILNSTSLKRLEVSFPHLPTQHHIAAVLDKADALRQQNQQLLAHYDELLQSTFIALFGDPVMNEKGWEVKKLGEVTQFLTSGSRGWAEYYSDSGSKFLRIQNVGYNKLKMDEIAYVIAPNTAEAKRTRVQANDILLSITADLGRTAVIPENFGEAYISQHLALLRLKGGINSTFISELLASEYCQRQFSSANKGGVKAGLNFNDIKSVNLLFPPLPLQNHFAEIVEKIEAQKEQTRTALAESEALFEGLLAGYFGEDQIHPKGSNPGPPKSQLKLF